MSEPGADCRLLTDYAGFGVVQGKAEQSIAFFLPDTNLELLIGTAELAAVINLSTRQLERLFRTHLQTTPTLYLAGRYLGRDGKAVCRYKGFKP